MAQEAFLKDKWIQYVAIVGRGKFNKLGGRSQPREAKLEGPWLGIRD